MFATPSAAADGLGFPIWKRPRRPATLFCTRSKFEELLEALKCAPNAEELLGGKVKPESPEETVATYVAAAKGLGLELSAEDVIEGIKVKVQERLAKTYEAVSEAAELSEDQLDKVAGGEILTQCEDTFEQRENCWITDGCDYNITGYFGYLCKNDNAGASRRSLGDCKEALFRF